MALAAAIASPLSGQRTAHGPDAAERALGLGQHRATFYEVRRAFQVGGTQALLTERRGPRGPHPNRVAPEIEDKILDYFLHKPTHGCQSVANELRLLGHNVSASGVRNVLLRHELETRNKRLLRLERANHDNAFVLSDEQVRLLERHSVDFRGRHVEAPSTQLFDGGLLRNRRRLSPARKA